MSRRCLSRSHSFSRGFRGLVSSWHCRKKAQELTDRRHIPVEQVECLDVFFSKSKYLSKLREVFLQISSQTLEDTLPSLFTITVMKSSSASKHLLYPEDRV